MGERIGRTGTFFLLSFVLLLAGCAAKPATVARSVPTAEPTPTATIGLSVAITAVPTAVPRPSPSPTPTRFVPPSGPWMRLDPNHGAPVSGSIFVVAGNLPARAPVTVSWSPAARGAPLSLDVLTGPRGNLGTPFSVPAAPPGVYHVTIASQGSVLGQAEYRVISRAALSAAAVPVEGGDQIAASGRSFLPRTRLLLVAYPLFRGARPVIVGTTRTNHSGAFAVQVVTRKAVPGEYVLRAYSFGTLAAQVAETYFEVSV